MDSEQRRQTDKEYIVQLQGEIIELRETLTRVSLGNVNKVRELEIIKKDVYDWKNKLGKYETEVWFLRMFVLYVIYLYTYGYIKYTF